MTDLEIVEGLKSGKIELLKKLYQHLPYIQRIALKNSGTREDGDDLFQEALIIFYEKVRKSDFVLTSSIKSYLYGIAHRLWLKVLRNKRKENAGDTALKEQIHLFETEEKDTEMLNRLKIALDKLDKLCHDLIISYYFHNLNMELIAKEFGYKTEQVARQQKYRCMQKIKKLV